MSSLDSFISYLSLEKNYSVHTVKAYQRDIESFANFSLEKYDIKNIDDVAYGIIRSWIVSLVNKSISNRTINRKVSSLKAFYRFLQRIEKISTNPLAKHKALKTAKKIEVPFSEVEMENVLQQIVFEDNFEGCRNKLMIELLYTTGMRRAELINLKLVDVDLSRNTILVLGKRNKERIIPLLPSTKQLFLGYFDERKNLDEIFDEGFAFLSKAGVKIYETLVY